MGQCPNTPTMRRKKKDRNKILCKKKDYKDTKNTKTLRMKRIYLIILGCIANSLLQAQELSGQYTTEWQWDMNKNTNWGNQLRLDLSVPLGSDRNTIEAATLHLAKTGESVIGDWQGFSNIDADNMLAAIAVLGFMHQWNSGHLFIGVRNVNEDFFISPITALFTNSSCGIFPTVAASYPIANYPFSGLTLYFDITKKGWTFRNSLYNGTGYNGWTAHDNPFLIKPKTDGIFNMSQIEYTHRSGEYYAGIAVHTRQQPFVTENETGSTMTETNETSVNGTSMEENTPNGTSPEETSSARTTFAWWLYGEQKLWTSGEKSISCMVQYSENSSHKNACYRYAEIGGAYLDAKNECGVSGQYAQFQQGNEYSLELTWKRQLTQAIAVQPSFQFIHNDDGNFTALSARLYLKF